MVVTLTRAKPSCSSAKIFSCWIWMSVQRGPCFARFCLAWMILLHSYPTGSVFAKSRMISRPLDSVCWWWGRFTEARYIQPHELGFLLRERHSRKSRHCYWDCHKKEQRAFGTLGLDTGQWPEGAKKKKDWNTRPLTTWILKFFFCNGCFYSFGLEPTRCWCHLTKRPFSARCPKSPDHILFFRLPWACL